MLEDYIARKERATHYDIPGGTSCFLYPDAPTGRLSCAYIEMDGRFPEKGFKKNLVCTESTFMIEGEFVVTLGDTKITLGPKDLLYVPLDTPYAVEGKGKAIVFIEPRWDGAQNIDC